jgi:hypothetical protein
MAKKKKAGPPYDTSQLDGKYIVVSEWRGLDDRLAPRGATQEATMVTAWLRRMFHMPELSVEMVFFMNTVCLELNQSLP